MTTNTMHMQYADYLKQAQQGLQQQKALATQAQTNFGWVNSGTGGYVAPVPTATPTFPTDLWGVPQIAQPTRDYTAEAVEIIKQIAKAFDSGWTVRNVGPDIIVEHKAMQAGVQVRYPGNPEYVSYVTTQIRMIHAAHERKHMDEVAKQKEQQAMAWMDEMLVKAEKARWKDNPPHRILAPRGNGHV